MIDRQYVKSMAEYNVWQNRSLTEAADQLTPEARAKDRGSFFGSIQKTLSHLLWGDQTWMIRFADTPPPAVGSIEESAFMVEDWEELKSQRLAMDQTILAWADEVSDEFLSGELSWHSGSQKRDITCKTGLLVVHMFNHQTHHRGQVHAMITAAGGNPDDTDLFVLEMRKQADVQ